MRLYKKAAVCLLAAAMAISMMTACGPTGGGNSNGGSNTGNSGTSQGGEEKPGDKDDNGANKDDQDDKKDDQDNSATPADPAKVTWETSMTKNYFNGISKNNFRVSGVYKPTGDLFAYATQDTKQLLFSQEQIDDENGQTKTVYVFFYTPDGKALYMTMLDKLPEGGIKVKELTGWQTIEEFGKSMDASDEDIAKEKADTFAQMREMKESIYIADKTPTAFKAEDTVMMNAAVHVETMEGIAVEGKTYTYMAVFAKENFMTYKVGDLAGVVKQNGSTTTINLASQVSACTSDTFPVIK